MQKRYYMIIWSLVILLLTGCLKTEPETVQNETAPVSGTDSTAIDESDKIQQTIATMSTEEKLGQLIMMGVENPEMDPEAKTFITEQHIGGVILFKRNFNDAVQSVNLINEIKKANTHGKAPLLIGVDEEGGRVTRLPEEVKKTPASRLIGQTKNSELAFQAGEDIGRKLAAFGINMNFAPVIDVDSNPNNPVIGDRSFGSDARLVSDMGIKEMQGLNSQLVIPVIKHFPGHGDTSVDSHVDLPVIPHDKERLAKLEILPFKKAIVSGADAVMVGHLLVEAYDAKTPASFSEPIINGLLRTELQFEGVVITDDLVMGAISKLQPIGDAAVQSIQAGTDILLIGHGYAPVDEVLASLKAAVGSGALSEERIDRSVERILQMKEKYALSDEPQNDVDVQGLNQQTAVFLQNLKAD